MMQAKNRYIELHLPDMAETDAGLEVDPRGYYGPIGKVVSLGENVNESLGISEDDWIVFYPELLRNYRIKGVIRNFIVDDGVVATITNAEVDAPVISKPKIEIVKGDPGMN